MALVGPSTAFIFIYIVLASQDSQSTRCQQQRVPPSSRTRASNESNAGTYASVWREAGAQKPTFSPYRSLWAPDGRGEAGTWRVCVARVCCSCSGPVVFCPGRGSHPRALTSIVDDTNENCRMPARRSGSGARSASRRLPVWLGMSVDARLWSGLRPRTLSRTRWRILRIF